MPQTHGVGRLFWHKVRLQSSAPRHHRWPTFEYDWPHRQSEAHVVRLVGWLGVAFGRWDGDKLDETEAAFKATQGRTERPDVVGEGGTTIEEQRELSYANAVAEEEARYDGWTVR